MRKGNITLDDSLDDLLYALLAENPAFQNTPIPVDYTAKRLLLRALMNVRPPVPIGHKLLELQDRLLSAERDLKGTTDPYRLPTIREQFGTFGLSCSDHLVLWKGDITTLSAGAIVNAANSKLLGCFIPHHRCIDNAIHSAAGIQLRLECSRIMQGQGFDEPTGGAKITRGYNLPATYVLHTVGPIIDDVVSDEDRRLMASCYTACLDLAANYLEIKTVAFCCISTGEFRFPKEPAAHIAVQTVCQWMEASRGRLDRVIFNVFTQDDYDVYSALFR
jgi:O-acetyl-ADP-ribose deacetylase (regulator of RNase III)